MAAARSNPRQPLPPPVVTIRTLREAHGLNVPMLVQRIAEQGVVVDEDHIRNCEIGWKRPSVPLLHAWAKALGITRPEVFFPDKETPEVLKRRTSKEAA